MFGKNLLKHIGEFRAYASRNQYEKAENGIYFPKARAFLSGVYIHNVNGEDECTDHNVIPDEALNHFLKVCLTAESAAIATWYITLHRTAFSLTSPAPTAANYSGNFVEATDTDGYSVPATNRQVWAPDNVDTVNTEVTNLATPAAFTISSTAPPISIAGAAIRNTLVKGEGTGVLMSVANFAAARSLAVGDIFNVKYKIDTDPA